MSFRCLLSAFLLVLLMTSAVQAQDADIRAIPAFGDVFGYEISPDGRLAATYELGVIHRDEVQPEFLPIHVYSLETGEEVLTLTGTRDYAAGVAFSPDGTTLASYHLTGYLYLWDLATGEARERLVLPYASLIEYLPDGRTVAIIHGQQMIVQLWDTETGAMTAALTRRDASMQVMRERLDETPIADAVTAAGVSPNNQIALASGYGNLSLWDVETQRETRLRQTTDNLPRFNIRALVFSPDGQQVIYLNQTEEIIGVLDAASGAEIATLTSEEALTTALDVSPDGTRAAWVRQNEDDTQTLVITPLDGSAAREIPIPLEDFGLSRGNSTIHFTPDGTQVIYGGARANSEDFQNALLVIDVA